MTCWLCFENIKCLLPHSCILTWSRWRSGQYSHCIPEWLHWSWRMNILGTPKFSGLLLRVEISDRNSKKELQVGVPSSFLSLSIPSSSEQTSITSGDSSVWLLAWSFASLMTGVETFNNTCLACLRGWMRASTLFLTHLMPRLMPCLTDLAPDLTVVEMEDTDTIDQSEDSDDFIEDFALYYAARSQWDALSHQPQWDCLVPWGWNCEKPQGWLAAHIHNGTKPNKLINKWFMSCKICTFSNFR